LASAGAWTLATPPLAWLLLGALGGVAILTAAHLVVREALAPALAPAR
jgi:hypothetical protein